MSVHGEYERTLEILILHLGKLPSESGQIWVEAFSALRMKHQPDLSTATRECLSLIDRIATEVPAMAMHRGDAERKNTDPQGNILSETASHLRAHCRAILGVSGLIEQ